MHTCQNAIPSHGCIKPSVWAHHALFIRPSADGHLGYFHLMAPVNRAAQALRGQASCGHSSISFGCDLGRRLAGSHGSSLFNYVRNHLSVGPGVFRSGSLTSQSHHHVAGPITLHLLAHLLLSDFFNFGHPGGWESVSHLFDLHFPNG